MLDPKHPTAILRAAWRTIRLDAIRAAANQAIAELESWHADGDHPRAESSDDDVSASTAALRACCEELREESGLTAVVAQSISLARTADPAWAREFANELARYRTYAGLCLTRSLNAP